MHCDSDSHNQKTAREQSPNLLREAQHVTHNRPARQAATHGHTQIEKFLLGVGFMIESATQEPPYLSLFALRRLVNALESPRTVKFNFSRGFAQYGMCKNCCQTPGSTSSPLPLSRKEGQ